MSKSKIAKVLLAIRHTEKGGIGENGKELSGTVIGPTGRKRLNSIILPRQTKHNGVHLFGSGCMRTHQCLVTLILTNNLLGMSHDPLFALGTDEMFNSWIANGFRDAVKETGSNFLGVKKMFGEQFPEEAKKVADDITFAFSTMDEGNDYALGLFHNPTIEMAAWYFDNSAELNLKEDEGVIFVQLEDGSIRYHGPWFSGDALPNIGDVFNA